MRDFFFVKYNKQYKKIAYSDILFIESARNYCKIFTEEGTLLV
jgi:DNA-binding LytR/AlgR family response regulator